MVRIGGNCDRSLNLNVPVLSYAIQAKKVIASLLNCSRQAQKGDRCVYLSRLKYPEQK
jgi:hypothetical protein